MASEATLIYEAEVLRAVLLVAAEWTNNDDITVDDMLEDLVNLNKVVDCEMTCKQLQQERNLAPNHLNN